MPAHRWILTVVIVFACASLLTGCKTKKPAGPDTLGGTVLPDENPLPAGGIWDESRRVSVQFENVLFDFDSAKIKDSERSKIEGVARYLQSNSGHRAIVEGHCDERGTSDYNMALGERRALAVRAYLIGLGIDSSRLLTKSFGEEKPVDPGHTESAWRLNRRDEFAIYR